MHPSTQNSVHRRLWILLRDICVWATSSSTRICASLGAGEVQDDDNYFAYWRWYDQHASLSDIHAAGYVHALNANHKMTQDIFLCPSGRNFVALLKECAGLKDVVKGQGIHAELIRRGLLETDPFVGSTLVSMYSEYGWITKAQQVFDDVAVRDIVVWNALITGYVKHGHGKEALNHYKKMQHDGVSPNSVTYICILKACGSIGAVERGRELHAEIFRNGLLKSDLVIGNTLVDMYARCGLFVKAEEVFEKLSVRTVVSWTTLIAGYAKFGHGEEAMNCLKQMQLAGVCPNSITYASILRACGSIGATEEGEELHAEIVNKGLEEDLVVGNALVDMYAKCGLLGRAQEVFDRLPARSVVLWTALITGYVKYEHCKEALICLELMQLDDVPPNAITFICGLKACSNLGAVNKGQELHVELARKGWLERVLPLSNALVDMYAKCGLLEKAQEVFDNLQVRDIISWTALLAGYAQHDRGEEAFNCLEQMQADGFSPNAATLVCSLKACGKVGAIVKGECLHMDIFRKGLESNILVGSTLVDMYARCGVLRKAQDVFEKLPVQDEVLWNALIAGYVHQGDSTCVFHLFDRMTRDGKRPDFVTFTSLLNTCSRAGLVDKCETYFEAMSKDHGVAPTLEHHSCMVDLLGRAGELIKALVMIKRMPFQPNLVVWRTVLGACRKWGNINLGMQVFHHAMQLDKKAVPDAISSPFRLQKRLQ